MVPSFVAISRGNVTSTHTFCEQQFVYQANARFLDISRILANRRNSDISSRVPLCSAMLRQQLAQFSRSADMSARVLSRASPEMRTTA